jgi:hypothetical protein
MIRQDSVVANFRCYFSLLNHKGYGLVAKHLLSAQNTRPDRQHCSDWGKLARVFYRRVGLPTSGLLSPYRLHPLCVLGATVDFRDLVGWEGSNLLHTHCTFCTQLQQMYKPWSYPWMYQRGKKEQWVLQRLRESLEPCFLCLLASMLTNPI